MDLFTKTLVIRLRSQKKARSPAIRGAEDERRGLGDAASAARALRGFRASHPLRGPYDHYRKKEFDFCLFSARVLPSP